MDDIITNTTPSAEAFISKGELFECIIHFNNLSISVLSFVTMDDGIFNLTIKGNYQRGSSVKISLSHPDMDLTIDEMYAIAVEAMKEYIPIMVLDDYPESLKKIAQEEAGQAEQDYGD